jgi:integration host factor subunit beta
MVKSELIIRIFEKQKNFSFKDVARGVNAILRSMSDALAKGDRIEIRGFGSFTCHYHAPRKAHNPRTGKRVFTSGRNKPHFKPGKALNMAVNANRDQPLKDEK